MPLISEIKLGWLVVRAVIGVVLVLLVLTLLLGLLGVEPIATLLGVHHKFNDPAPLVTWAQQASSAFFTWVDEHRMVYLAVLPLLAFFALVWPNH